MKVTCNTICGKEFKIKALNSRRLKDDIDQVYFTCPHCKKEYPAYFLNEKIRTMQAEQRKNVAGNKQAEAEWMKLEIKAEMDKIRVEIENGNALP